VVGDVVWGGALYWRVLVVIVEGEGAVLYVSLGHCMVIYGKFNGWLCGSGCGIVTKRLSGPVGMVVGVGPGIGVLNFGGNHQTGKGSFRRGECLGLSIVTMGLSA